MSAEQAERHGRKVYRAKSFAVSALTCPSCHGILVEAAVECPRCGYDGRAAVARFPFEAPLLERWIDPRGFVGEREQRKVNKALDRLTERFPQVRVCFCLVELARETDLREFGFWMLNASPVPDAEEAKRRPWTVLLLLDEANVRASVTAGYAVEPFLSDEDLVAVLFRSRRAFLGRDFETGLVGFVEGLSKVLDDGADRAEQKLARSRRKRKKRTDDHE